MEIGLDNVLKTGENDIGNYGRGLAVFPQQNGKQGQEAGKGGQNSRGQEAAVNTSGSAIGANTISRSNGIPNEEGLHQISGWEKPFKGTALKRAVNQLNAFHEAMDGEVSVDNIQAIHTANDDFLELVREVSSFVDGARRKSSWFHKKEEAALLPAMSSLLIQLYSMGNAFDNKENLAYDYLMEGNFASARVGDIITGRSAMSVQGNMVSTGIESGQIDRTAQQLHEWEKDDNPQADYLQELKSRRLPSRGDKNAVESLERIARMLDDIELQSKDSIQREDIRTQFIDVTKMVHLLLMNPDLMTGEGVEKLKSGKMSHEKTDLLNTAEFFQATAGMTVQEATQKLDEIRQTKAETAAQDSIVGGGALSQVFIDKEKNRVLRTSKEKSGIEEQKAKNNFNYDEAMSRLGEITGLGGQAGARTTYYKDLEGNLQYGTNMDKASGKQARDVKLSFGDEQVDSQMKAGRHNIFGHGSKEELERNAGLIISSFKMQIIDYLSTHQDRHNENFFIDLNAKDPEQAFMGIDNDNVFGIGTGLVRDGRTVAYKAHATGTYEQKRDGYRDVTTTLKGFQCIPQDTKNQIDALNEEKIGEAMKPYLDRAARLALIRRVKKLKAYVSENAKIIDIRTEAGMQEFKKETMGLMAKSMMEIRDGQISLLGRSGAGSHVRALPGILMRALGMQYFGIGQAAKVENSEEYRYFTEFEYMTEEKTVPEYFNNNNKKEREQKFWNSFEGMIRAAGMEENEEYLKLKKDFMNGEINMFW